MIFENKSGKKNQVIFEKEFEIRNQKDLIENYFEKDVVKKIWLVLKRCDWEYMIWKNILKDLILKINDLAIKKRYDSKIKPFSTEKATYLKCWIKSLIVGKYFWGWKEIDFENIWLKRYGLKKIWFWKIMKTWKKILN